jgi:hypothetical protein
MNKDRSERINYPGWQFMEFKAKNRTAGKEMIIGFLRGRRAGGYNVKYIKKVRVPRHSLL